MAWKLSSTNSELSSYVTVGGCFTFLSNDGERSTCTHWMWGLLLPRWNRTSCPVDTILSQRMLVAITFVSDESLAWLALARTADGKTSSSVFPVMCGTYFYDINIIPSSYRSMRVLLCDEIVAVVWQTWLCYRLFDTWGTYIDNVLIVSWLDIFFYRLEYWSESFLCVSSVSTPCFCFTDLLFRNNCVHMTAFCCWMSMPACLERFEVDEERGFAD